MNTKFPDILRRFRKFLLLTVLILPATAFAQARKLRLFNFEIDCYPSLPPASGGCGIGHFIDLIRQATNFLTVNIAIPVTVGMIVVGGIAIMTAGGSEERFRKGRAIIFTALIGLGIVLGAALILNTIYMVLTGTSIIR